MAKDARALREEAAEATATGKYKRALAAYLELERLDPRDAQWAKRAGETYRRLGNHKHAIEAFRRSAERYAQNGFLVQAIAVCKLVLQIDPQHVDTLRRLAAMNEQIGQAPTRAAGMADNNPALHDTPAVAAIRHTGALPVEARPRRASEQSGLRRKPGSTPQITLARTRSRPVAVIRGAALDTVNLREEFPDARQRDRSAPGIHIIPIDDPIEELPDDALEVVDQVGLDGVDGVGGPGGPGDPDDEGDPGEETVAVPRRGDPAVDLAGEPPVDPGAYPDVDPSAATLNDEGAAAAHGLGPTRSGARTVRDLRPIEDDLTRPGLVIEIEPPDPTPLEEEELDQTVLELADVEEIPLPEPRAIGAAGRQALAATPLFAGLPSEVLEALVAELVLVGLDPGQELFHEGEPGDALYVIVEGEVEVHATDAAAGGGPPLLGPGSFIGEVALLTDQPRSATVLAATPAELLRIDRGTLADVLGAHGDLLRAVLRFVRDRLVDRWMQTSPLFRALDEGERVKLAGRFAFLEIDAGTNLIGAGMRPDGLYIVLAGEFIVRRGNQIIAQLGPGNLIGETALLAGGAFRSDVIAHGKSLALCLPAAAFREIIMTHPHVLEYIGEQAEHSRRLQIL